MSDPELPASAAKSPGEHLRRINAFALALLDAQDLDDLLWSISDRAGEILGFEDCVVYLRVGDVMVQRAAFGVKGLDERKIFNRIEIPVGEGIVGTVAETGVAELIADTGEDPRYILDEFPGRSELTVPVLYEGRVIAVLDSEAAEAAAYGPADMELLQSVANIAAARIASAVVDEKLRRAQDALRQANEDLERRVKERTVELERQREQLRLILRSIGDGIISTDGRGRVVFMSVVAEFLTGWPAEKAVGLPLDKVYRVLASEEEEGWVSWRERPQLAEGTPSESGEWILESRGHERRRVSESLAAIQGEAAAGWVLVFRDVTQQRRVEEELRRTQQLESLGALAGGIAHDFNNYLTIIQGNLEFLSLSPELGPFEHLLQAVEGARQASGQAAGLPRQLMTLAKGGGPMKTRAVDLVPLVRQATEFCLSGSNLRAELDLDADLGPVDVDEGQITQVLNNLLINAVQVMPDGGDLRVEAATRTDDSGRSWSVISIEDEGPGIPKETLARIFDPFYTTRDAGSGLGLTTAHSVIQRHGGFMKVSSEVGRGTRFEVWLGSSRAKPIVAKVPPRPKAEPQSFHVLVLEDEEGIQRILAKALTAQGHRASCVTAPDQALEECTRAQLNEDRFDVALLDVTMPGGGGGSKTLARLRKIQPLLPAVVMSGYSDQMDLEHYQSRGFQAALMKPFSLSELGGVLKEAVDQFSE